MGFISNTIPTTKIKIAPARLSIVQNHYLLRVILFENEIGN